MHEVTQKTFEMARNRALYFVLVHPGPVIPAALEWSLLHVPEVPAGTVTRASCRRGNSYLRNPGDPAPWRREPFALR
jgi:hypothetical protein